jgi:class 3 adenylate cyclase
MQCPQCHTENREQRRFCAECGAQLNLACVSCGFGNEPGEKFCGGCGIQIVADAPASEPEEMHALLNQFFELALAEVHRYEGTINQFLGDGFMALFGAPLAHEDHARRAALAALDVQRELEALVARTGQSIKVRMGLNSGAVVIGAIGDNLRMDYTAVGDTTNIAARLQQLAEQGQILVSEPTFQAIDGYCNTDFLGEFSIKGIREQVKAWGVVSDRGARTRLEIAAERGLTPFVGRERELVLLRESFEKARIEQGQMVFIVGEPGIGKSRLLYEFHRQLGNEATWSEGHSVSFGWSIAYHPLIDLLKRNFRIDENDAENAIIEKIEHGVLRLGDDLKPILPYIRYLLAVDPGDPAVKTMEPQLRRAEIFDGLRRLTLRAAEIHPQVVVFEDLHWMDQATEFYLRFITDSIPAGRLLLILTYRPG